MSQNTPISFLLGAGFSQPAGYPLASGINELFVNLKETDFSIHSDGTAWLNNGQPGPNDWFMRREQRLFAVSLLGYYRDSVASPGTFHYEEFYDWYKDLRRGRSTDTLVQAVAAGSREDFDNHLLNFDFTFNQLLAQPLAKRCPEVHLCRDLLRTHATFLELVETLGRQHTLHFHSLNHDLFFESLSSTDAIQGELADGFTDLGSPYYGIAEVVHGTDRFSYTVRLPRFVNKFGSRFNLYKLHGSVDQYVFHDDAHETIKNQRGIGPDDLMKEVRRNGERKYERNVGAYYPSYLSGTTFKTLQYGKTHYYRAVFKHFKSNLECSSVLLVIGYGFRDAEINRLISEHFLIRPDSKLLVVDVCKPDLPSGFAKSTQFLKGGVSSFNLVKLLEWIPTSQSAK